jgi:hypothetical protein
MDGIDFLEHGGGGAMVRHHGVLLPLTDPCAEHYQEVLRILQDGHVPGTPPSIPWWQRDLVFERWRAAWDLPAFDQARRLTYLVDKYRSAIASDLRVHAGVDLGDLWRARRWTHLLDLLDHLPGHSWFASAVSMDEEHAKMMAESIIARRESGEESDQSPQGPSLVQWTPEVAVMTNVLDAVRGVQHAVVAVNAGDKAPAPPRPAPRPITPLERALRHADYVRRKAKHDALADRVLQRNR